MIEYREFRLDNGLDVILSKDDTTPLVAVNLMFGLGAKHDPADKTGLAHFLEHMMFTGTKNVPDIDESIQLACGDNNAFTNQDIINFFTTLPCDHLEWLLHIEADRMGNMHWSDQKFEIQKKVILEEFEETVHSEPYADYWHHLGALVYAGTPYEWPTIGARTAHIKNISLEDIKTVYECINPYNGVLSICGPIDYEQTRQMITHVFSELDKTPISPALSHGSAPEHLTREKTITKDIPEETVFLAFKMPGRRSNRNHLLFDFIADMLSRGNSSLLYKHMVEDKELCSDVDTWLSGTFDEGLIIVELNCEEDISLSQVKAEFWNFIGNLTVNDNFVKLATRIKNKLNTQVVLAESNISNKALILALHTCMGDTAKVNTFLEVVEALTVEEIFHTIKRTFSPHQAFILNYANA